MKVEITTKEMPEKQQGKLEEVIAIDGGPC